MDKQDKINTIKRELDKGKEPILLNDDELQYIKKPLGQAHYKKAIKEKTYEEEMKEYNKERAKHRPDSIYIDCDICERTYTKYNKDKHIKTKHHQFCVKLNKKWRKMIIDD